MKIGRLSLVFVVLGGLILCLLFVPVAGIFFDQFAINLGSLLNTMTDIATLKAVGVSLFAAFLSVLIAFSFGVPLAYLLAKRDFPGKGFVEGIVDLPMAIPHTVAGIALLAVLGSGGIVGGATESFLRFEGAFPGIVAAMTFVSASFLINSSREGFQSVNTRLENVARNLGASEWQCFRKVTFPLAFPHIFSGAVMSWARAISEFSAVVMLVGFFPMIAPGLIWSRFQSTGLESAMSVAVILLLVVLPTFMILRYLGGRLFDRS